MKSFSKEKVQMLEALVDENIIKIPKALSNWKRKKVLLGLRKVCPKAMVNQDSGWKKEQC